jgi:hypothetical protein
MLGSRYTCAVIKARQLSVLVLERAAFSCLMLHWPSLGNKHSHSAPGFCSCGINHSAGDMTSVGPGYRWHGS